MAKTVTVYSTATCPFCIRAKQFLKDNNIQFTNYDVGNDRAKADEMMKKSGQMGVPVIDIGGEIVVGFDKDRLRDLLGSLMTYDLIVIGAGPAGITASVYAARKKLDLLTITMDIGGQAAWSGDVENYTGYQFVTGPELAMKFEDHLRRYEIKLKEGEEAREVRRSGDAIFVRTDKGEYVAKAVIIASGKISKELGVPGEKEFRNRGLTYCATCDGPLFQDRDVAVIGGGNSALDAALQLTRIAKKIWIVNNTPWLGGDKIMREKVVASPLVTVLNDAKVLAITGERMVTGITVSHEGVEKAIPVQGVFVEIGLVPNAGFVKDVLKNQLGEIAVNCNNETSVPGIFAAGDVTNVPEKQIIIAAGEGAKAVLSAFKYLNHLKQD